MNAIETITATVAEIRRVTIADILSARKSRDITGPRQEAMYFARRLTPASLPAIGRRIGGRDHTTVLNALKRVETKIAVIPGYGDELDAMGVRISAALPHQGQCNLVPADDIDVVELARRIDEAVRAGESLSVYADDVVALSDRVLKLEAQMDTTRGVIAGAQPIHITLVDAPQTTSVATPPDVLPSEKILPAVQAAVRAWDSLQTQRFSSRERFAQQVFDRAFANLKTIIETERS